MSGSGARHWEQNKDATCYVGNLDERVTTHMLTELMINMGRVVGVHLPIDRVNGSHLGYGFVEFQTEQAAAYAANILNGVRLFDKQIRVNKASADKQKAAEIGAELFIGSLDSMVNEKSLYDTFSCFGPLLSAPKIARDEVGISRGYGFISFGDFESADAAIEHMDGQYMMNKQIAVQYAFKRDGKGERHGDAAERMLAKQAKAHGVTPATQPLPAHLFHPAPIPNSSVGMANSDGRGFPGAPRGPSVYAAGPPGGGRPPAPASLPPPPSGLPARPPTGTVYTPPVGFNGGAPGFGAPGPGSAW